MLSVIYLEYFIEAVICVSGFKLHKFGRSSFIQAFI